MTANRGELLVAILNNPKDLAILRAQGWHLSPACGGAPCAPAPRGTHGTQGSRGSQHRRRERERRGGGVAGGVGLDGGLSRSSGHGGSAAGGEDKSEGEGRQEGVFHESDGSEALCSKLQTK